MTATRWGITVPVAGLPLVDHRALFEEIESLGYEDLWSIEADTTDAFTPLVLAAAWTRRLRLGTAIVNVFTRTPALLAMSCASLAEAAPGRCVIGLGPSTPAIVGRWNGVPYEKPLSRTRDALLFLREALRGERIDRQYDTMRSEGFRLGLVPKQPPPLMVAALQPKMVRLAGELAAGVILNWVTPEDVAFIRKEMDAAALAAGRDPAALEVILRVTVNITEDVDGSIEASRRHTAAYLSQPGYERSQAWLGRGAMVSPMARLFREGKRQEAVEAIPTELVRALRILGDQDYCRRRLAEYAAAGATTIVYSLVSDAKEPQARLAGQLRAMRELAPAQPRP